MYKYVLMGHTTVNINELVKRDAKLKGLNMSAELERALKLKLYGSNKENVPEENKKVFCFKCSKQINKGYYCPQSRKAWCVDCHKGLDIDKECFSYHDITIKNKIQQKEHEHIYWTETISHRPVEENGFINKSSRIVKEDNSQYWY
jgi:hypothetical protein